MSNYSVTNVEEVISLLEETQANLIKVLRGRELTEDELKMHKFSVPAVSINPRRLRIATDAVTSALKEARALAK